MVLLWGQKRRGRNFLVNPTPGLRIANSQEKQLQSAHAVVYVTYVYNTPYVDASLRYLP